MQGATDELPRERQSWREKFEAAEKQEKCLAEMGDLARMRSEHSQMMNDALDEMD